MNDLTLDEYSALFRESGGTDFAYLNKQYKRFCSTKERFESTWHGGRRVLDVGAHWLHQALLYARDGYAVTAVDFPETFVQRPVQSLARSNGITLIECLNLENPTAFRHLADNSFDIILFTEIIEHITFNPISMWREFYRLLSVGGRIVVTTPNYYSIDGRFWRPRRLFGRTGGGITVEDIITHRTYAHHWKEFSRRELLQYFELLSPDFVPRKALYVDDSGDHSGHRAFRSLLRPFITHLAIFRPNLHVEIELIRKQAGISVVAGW